jgi:hypothetical protein
MISTKDGIRNHFVSPQLLRIWTDVATFFRNYYWIEFLTKITAILIFADLSYI